jgi:hypothetical protein
MKADLKIALASINALPSRIEFRVGARVFSCARIDSTSFELDGKHYPVGSWIVRTAASPYATAMTDVDFRAWRDGLGEKTA